jgi:hypothetical protein
MRIAQYEFKDGARFQRAAHNADPNLVGARLELLRKQQKGELTPVDVVKDGRDEKSPLHPFFEWDDGKAADQHRLDQARGLIRAVVAVYVDGKNPARRMSAFVHIPEGDASHYRDTVHALSQKRTRDIILQQAWREFQAWRRRYEELDELASLFDVADKLRLPDGR